MGRASSWQGGGDPLPTPPQAPPARGSSTLRARGPFSQSNEKNYIPAVKIELGVGEGLIRASSTRSSEPNVFICHVNAIKGYMRKITEFIASKGTKPYKVSLLYKNIAAVFNICNPPHKEVYVSYVL